jgi:hypothetical protein
MHLTDTQTVLLYFGFSAAVSSMPEPDANSGTGYTWLYHFLHVLAGDLSHVVGSRIQKP